MKARTTKILKQSIKVMAGTLLLAITLGACTNSASTAGSVPGSSARYPANSVEEKAGEGTKDSEARIRVVTTTSVNADFIRQVGQDRVLVRNLVPAGRDPHTFQPTPQDAKEISEARISFVNGMGLEGPLEKLIRTTSRTGTPVIALAEGLPALEGGDEDEGDNAAGKDVHAGSNPHMWLAPRLSMRYIQRIQVELSSVDPARGAIYEANAKTYLNELAELDAWIEKQVLTIPSERRKLVTFHDAFPYYSQRYGLKLIGVVVRSPGQEPSAREVAELVDTIRREGVHTVFAEPQLNARVLELVAREAGVSLAYLYSDSIDDKVTSYSSMMRYNTEQVVNGLR